MAITNSLSQNLAAASQTAISQFQKIDDYRRQRTTEALNKYMPQFASIIGQGAADLSSFLSSVLPQFIKSETATYNQLKSVAGGLVAGQVPTETIGSIRRAGAVRPGMGQISSNMTARDIGMSSIQLQQLGAQMLQQASAAASGVTAMQASATSQLGAYTTMGKNIADMFNMSPELLTQLQSQLNQSAISKYTADLQAQAEAARLAQQAKLEAAKLAEEQYQFKSAIAQSGVNQQLGIIAGTQGVRALATSNPSYVGYANQYIQSAASQNRSIADWTNKLLRGGMGVPNFGLGRVI